MRIKVYTGVAWIGYALGYNVKPGTVSKKTLINICERFQEALIC